MAGRNDNSLCFTFLHLILCFIKSLSVLNVINNSMKQSEMKSFYRKCNFILYNFHKRIVKYIAASNLNLFRGSFMKTLFSLYLVLAVILSQYFSAYFFKGQDKLSKAFSALVFCISIYLFGYLMIINSSNLQEMIFWNQVQYFGLPFISVLWLTVALLYTRTICSLKTIRHFCFLLYLY